MFTQGRRVTGKLEVLKPFCNRKATQLFMFMMGDYVREMTVKNSCMVNMDHLSICSSCIGQLFILAVNNYKSSNNKQTSEAWRVGTCMFEKRATKNFSTLPIAIGENEASGMARGGLQSEHVTA